MSLRGIAGLLPGVRQARAEAGLYLTWPLPVSASAGLIAGAATTTGNMHVPGTRRRRRRRRLSAGAHGQREAGAPGNPGRRALRDVGCFGPNTLRSWSASGRKPPPWDRARYRSAARPRRAVRTAKAVSPAHAWRLRGAARNAGSASLHRLGCW